MSLVAEDSTHRISVPRTNNSSRRKANGKGKPERVPIAHDSVTFLKRHASPHLEKDATAELLANRDNPASVAELVALNLGLVVSKVTRNQAMFEASNMGRGPDRDYTDMDEALSEGIIGFISGVDRYDETIGVKFSSYAGKCADRRSAAFLRDNRLVHIPGQLLEYMPLFLKACNMIKEKGEELTEKGILSVMEELAINRIKRKEKNEAKQSEKIERAIKRLHKIFSNFKDMWAACAIVGSRFIGTCDTPDHRGDEGYTPVEAMKDPTRSKARSEHPHCLSGFLETLLENDNLKRLLDEREIKVIEYRFELDLGSNHNKEFLELREIADDILHISRQTVLNMEKVSLLKLKEAILILDKEGCLDEDDIRGILTKAAAFKKEHKLFYASSL